MSRWAPGSRGRLERAAFELFAEQGFAATTVPQITARAGLTTRTFFRHFADKREVIFAGDEIPALARRLVAEAPAGTDPLTLLVEGLRTVSRTRFDGRRERVRQVRALIASDDSLRERDLAKRAALAEAARDGLVERGLGVAAASLLAETAVTALHVGIEEWLDAADEQPLHGFVLGALGTLRSELAGLPGLAHDHEGVSATR